MGHRHRSNRSGLRAARREYPELLISEGEAGAAGWLCWKSISCSLRCDICAVAQSITFQGISLCFLRPEFLSLWKMRIWGCSHCWFFQHTKQMKNIFLILPENILLCFQDIIP